MSAVDGREVHLDLRLVPAALTSWGVTAAGILWSISGVIVVLLGGDRRRDRGGMVGSRPSRSRARGVRMTAAGTAAIALVGLGFAIAVQLRVDQVRHHPLVDRYGTRRGRHRHAKRDAAVARRRQDDVPRIAAGRRHRRNVRPGSGFHVGRRVHRADCGPARRIQGPDRQTDPARSHRRRSVGNR